MDYRKDYIQACNDRWKDEYYTLIDVVDRCIDLLTDKYGTLYRASLAFGKSRAYFNKTLSCTYTPPRTVTLTNICKFLNVSIDYVVFGTNKEEYKGPVNITYKNFIDIYNTAYKGCKCPRLNACLCMWKKIPYKQIPLKYLIKVAREQKVTIDWLIGG